MSTWALVLAAGSGARFGARKQFEPLGDRRVIDHVVATATGACDHTVLVLPPDHEWPGDDVHATVAGGATHHDSFLAGLAAIPRSAEVIVVVSAAHPLATGALYRSVIDTVAGGADAATPAVALADALKRVDGTTVTASVPKADIRSIQAPSAFAGPALREAASRARVVDEPAGEEVELIERAGFVPVTVAGEATNVHIATPIDLDIANALLPLVSLHS